MRRISLLTLCAVLLLVMPLLFKGTAGAAPAGRIAYWVMADIVRGSFEPVSTICVQTSVFKQGEEVVWRVVVRDPATGNDPGDGGKSVAAIQERALKVTAYLENNMNFPLKYGQHPPRPKEGEPVQWFWATSWKIPTDYPTGKLKWWVIVQDKAGAFVRFDPIGTGTLLPASVITVEKR